MDILKNDVIAILNEKVNSKSTRNGHYSKLSSGAVKKQFELGELGAPANMSFALPVCPRLQLKLERIIWSLVDTH